MKLNIGFSPCPNDTFIFDALVNKKIDTGDISFDVVLEDVETLNEWALHGKLDITKLSFPAFFRAAHEYILLDSGSALGKGVGPLLVSHSAKEYSREEIEQATIAIPGMNTTANLLLGFAFPHALHKKPMVFSAIENAVKQKRAELGVIIHENRFTYQQKGLHKVMDLGEFWENNMKTALPLGGIAMKRKIDKKTRLTVENLIKKSLEFAFDNYPEITGYVKRHSQSMSEEVMKKHIDLYVNEYSLSLGDKGREAIEKMYVLYSRIQKPKQQIPADNLFAEPVI